MHFTAFFAYSLRICLTLILYSFAFAVQATWYPADVIADGKKTAYTPLTQTQKAWRICALLPPEFNPEVRHSTIKQLTGETPRQAA
ncbi:hypothetical protein [Shewanella sp.]|uniref:hypothetical protein n=1 Tax=Shewanella sp. TaxID=50422 RepID=UPI00257D0B6C|nr:hypothetical protein [Shewanella sp.]